jgi:peptide/nickel transport system substrate-binding protein
MAGMLHTTMPMRCLLVVLALACSEANRPPEGVLVVAIPDPWEPRLASPRGTTFSGHVAGVLLGTLTRLDDRGEIALSLARAVERQEDGLTWIVRLRDDARFASGRAIQAADVVASIGAQLSPAQARAVLVDPLTIRLTTAAPSATLPAELSWTGITRADQVEAFWRGALSYEELDASGPWTVVRVREPDVILGRNPWYMPAPSTEGHVMRAAGDKRGMVAAVLSGEADRTTALAGRISEVLRHLSHRVLLAETTDVRFGVLRFNCASPKLADVRVRHALNLAVDRARIVPRFADLGSLPAYSLDPQSDFGSLHDPPYDPAKAERLLDEAGFPRGADGTRMELEVLLPLFAVEEDDLIQAVLENLRDIGVRATLYVRPNTEVQSARAAGHFELTWTWIRFSRTDPSTMALAFFRTEGAATGLRAGQWDFGRCTTKIQPLAARANRAMTRAERDEAVAAMLAATRADPPALYVHHRMIEEWAPPRFRASANTREASYELRPELALPRDRLSYWLQD